MHSWPNLPWWIEPLGHHGPRTVCSLIIPVPALLPVEVLMWAGERGTACWRNLILFHTALSEGHGAPKDAGQRACSQRPEL